MEQRPDEIGRRNPNSRRWQAVVHVIPTCRGIDPDADAVPREEHPLRGPKNPDELQGYNWWGRMQTARGDVFRVSERLWHRAAGAEDQNEPREGFDEVHLRQA